MPRRVFFFHKAQAKKAMLPIFVKTADLICLHRHQTMICLQDSLLHGTLELTLSFVRFNGIMMHEQTLYINYMTFGAVLHICLKKDKLPTRPCEVNKKSLVTLFPRSPHFMLDQRYLKTEGARLLMIHLVGKKASLVIIFFMQLGIANTRCWPIEVCSLDTWNI